MAKDISQGRAKLWRQCKFAHWCKYILGIERKVKKGPLVRGNIIHDMLEAHIAGKDPMKVFGKAKDKYRKMFRNEREEYQEMMETIEILMKNYFRWFKSDPLKYLKFSGQSSEFEFSVPVSNQVNFVGFIDAAAESQDNRRWLVEHKSRKQIPKSIDERYWDIQAAVYVWVMPKIGLGKPKGVMWNYIKYKKPAVPEILKSGELSKRANIDTMWPVYKQAIVDNDLDVSDYKDMKGALKFKEDDFFVRLYLPVSQKLVKNIIREFRVTAHEIVSRGDEEKIRSLGIHCNNCDYYNYCQADLRGLDTKVILDADYQKRKKRKEPKKVWTI